MSQSSRRAFGGVSAWISFSVLSRPISQSVNQPSVNRSLLVQSMLLNMCRDFPRHHAFNTLTAGDALTNQRRGNRRRWCIHEENRGPRWWRSWCVEHSFCELGQDRPQAAHRLAGSRDRDEMAPVQDAGEALPCADVAERVRARDEEDLTRIQPAPRKPVQGGLSVRRRQLARVGHLHVRDLEVLAGLRGK